MVGLRESGNVKRGEKMERKRKQEEKKRKRK